MPTYDLFGVVVSKIIFHIIITFKNHFGAMNSGHYISYVKN